MALPVFIGVGIAALTSVAGIGNMVSAGIKSNESKEVNLMAADLVEESKQELEKYRIFTSDCLKKLGETKLKISSTTLAAFVKYFSKIKSISESNSEFIEKTNDFNLNDFELCQMNKLSEAASVLVKGGLAGVGAGALIGWGVYNGVALLGTAGTGTAITALSGVAASNATLAWIGGGTAAAGGLGVAGGSAILGGLIAGPALLILGGVINSNATKNLNDSYSSLDEAKIFSEQALSAREELLLMSKCAIVLNNNLVKLTRLFTSSVKEMIKIVNRCPDWNCMTIEEKQIVSESMNYAMTIKQLLDIPILNTEGKVTNEAQSELGKYTESLNSNLINVEISLSKKDLLKWKSDNVDKSTEDFYLLDPQKQADFLCNLDLPDASRESYYVIAAVNRENHSISCYSVIPRTSVDIADNYENDFAV